MRSFKIWCSGDNENSKEDSIQNYLCQQREEKENQKENKGTDELH